MQTNGNKLNSTCSWSYDENQVLAQFHQPLLNIFTSSAGCLHIAYILFFYLYTVYILSKKLYFIFSIGLHFGALK